MTTTATTVNYSGVTGILHSYSDNRRYPTPSGTGRQISYGDRLFAKLVMKGRTIFEFMVSQVNDFTELLGELRKHCRNFKGLARLYVRNVSRGWSLERPLMLYSESKTGNVKNHDTMRNDSASRVEQYMIKDRNGMVRQVAFPWDL